MTEQYTTPDERAELFIQQLEEGRTYSQVALLHTSSSDAVRNVVRRYNHKKYGTYTGYTSTPRQTEDPPVPPPEDKDYDADDGTPALRSPVDNLEIWNVDIERFPRIEYSWSAKRYNKFTPEYLLIEDSRMVSFAAKKLGGPTIFSSEFHHGRKNMLDTLWHILDRATIVVGWNTKRFDIPHIDGELRDEGYPVYKPFKQIDLFQSVRSRFGYDYNTMKSVAARWGLEEQKMENEGFDLWKRCMKDDPEAWDIMKRYNMQDVRTCEDAYISNLQWLVGSIPNLGLWVPAADGMGVVCPACASEEVYKDGTASTGVTLYRAYRCKDCGYRSRSNEKISSTILRPIAR